MPRHARVRLAGCTWHVWQRGVNRSPCFVDDLDRQRYLGLLKEQGARHGCFVHAYVLMTNHVHLLITPDSDDGLSATMKAINERYVAKFNRRHGRTGPLWEGRHRSNLVQSERYLFVCQTYIELNPVRADMVRHPADYPWSSYLTNATGSPSGLITPHERYVALGRDASERGRAYQQLFHMPPSSKQLETIRGALASGYALGDLAFVKGVENAKGIPMAPRKRGRKRHDAESKTGRNCSSPRELGVRPLFE